MQLAADAALYLPTPHGAGVTLTAVDRRRPEVALWRAEEAARGAKLGSDWNVPLVMASVLFYQGSYEGYAFFMWSIILWYIFSRFAVIAKWYATKLVPSKMASLL